MRKFVAACCLFSLVSLAVGCGERAAVVVEDTRTEAEQAQANADYDKQMAADAAAYEKQGGN